MKSRFTPALAGAALVAAIGFVAPAAHADTKPVPDFENCADAKANGWAEPCVEYFAQRTETKLNTNRFALAASTVNLNFVARQDHATQRESGCCLAFELGFPVDRKGIATC